MPRLWRRWVPIGACLLASLACWRFSAAAPACDGPGIVFSHRPSEFYGSGEYLAQCPATGQQIRCYHYHRHWICQKGDTYHWDRNLDSAARTACGCPLPPGTAPSAPAVSTEPASRFHDYPAGGD